MTCNITSITHNHHTDVYPLINININTNTKIHVYIYISTELVFTDGEGYKAISYARGTALVGQAVKELSDVVMSQQEQIDLLLKELVDVKLKLDSLKC